MSTIECPLPEVSQALDPFIKPRDEVTAIRRGLQSYLESQLFAKDGQLTAINVSSPTDARLENPPSTLAGVRRAYWKALQAHNTAQANYDALRADLQRLKTPKAGPKPDDSDPTRSVNVHYIPILQQREKQRKLRAIETAYTALESAGDDLLPAGTDGTLQTQAGGPPAPPPGQANRSQGSEIDSKIAALKKTIISTKRTVGEIQDRPSSIAPNSITPRSAQTEVLALQRALQKLTTWMETQLGVISDAETEDRSSDSPNCKEVQPQISHNNIEDLYRQYLDAREGLIRACHNQSMVGADIASDDTLVEQLSHLRDSQANPKTSAEVILPYIPALARAKREEQSLMQENAYIRRQITSDAAELARLLHRLATESHLVQPDAISGVDWATAAREAAQSTDTFVLGRVASGERSANSAAKALQAVDNLMASLAMIVDEQ